MQKVELTKRLKSGKLTLEQHTERVIDGRPYRFEYCFISKGRYQILCCAAHKWEGYRIEEFETVESALNWINDYEGDP